MTPAQQKTPEGPGAGDREPPKVSEHPPEDPPEPPVRGAEGGDDSPAADALPSHPSRDSSPLGDTDQHSAS